MPRTYFSVIPTSNIKQASHWMPKDHPYTGDTLWTFTPYKHYRLHYDKQENEFYFFDDNKNPCAAHRHHPGQFKGLFRPKTSS